MISGTKILKHLDNIAERRPVTAQIQLNNFCNNYCSFCQFVGLPIEQKKSITIDEFKEYVKILKGLGVKGFILSGGEPTISDDFDKITEWLENNSIPYGVNTNLNILKYIKPVYLKVSIDGYDAKSYKNVRRIDRYDTVIENLEKYIAWKKKNSAKTSVGIQIIGTDVETCQRFYDAHKNLDIDYMSFRPIETVGYYQSHDVKPVVELLESLREKDKRVLINYKYHHVHTCFEKCYGNFLQMSLNAFGEVQYCCHMINDIVGHITDPDILEKKAAYPMDMKKCFVPCRMDGPNILMKDMQTKGQDDMFI